MRQTNADLRRYYRIFNRKYFKGKLPEVPIRFAKMHKKWTLGTTWLRHGKALDIEINKNLQNTQCVTVMTVVHEMVHVEHPTWKGHGWQFDRRMLRLAKAGAFDGLW